MAAVPAVFFVSRPNASWGTVVGYGLAIGVGQSGLIFLALAVGFPAGLATPAAQTQVSFTIAIWAWVGRERPAARLVVGTLLAACGIVVLGVARRGSGMRVPLVGLLLMLGGARSCAVGDVVAKRAAQVAKAPLDALSLVVWSSLAAPLPLAARSSLTQGASRRSPRSPACRLAPGAGSRG